MQKVQKSPQTQKQNQNKHAIYRAQYLKKLVIKVKQNQKTYTIDQLISISTFNIQKNTSVEFVIRKLSQLDSLILHLNHQYGGHIIPFFKYDLYNQDQLKTQEFIPAIQQYLNDLKHNKYCRQDAQFYCFIIEQHSSFPTQIGFQRLINNATNFSRRYLNQIFTRQAVRRQKTSDVLKYAQKQLNNTIQQYLQVKQITLLKAQQVITFQQITGFLVQITGQPSLAISPQQHDIQLMCKAIASCQKLIEQAKQAFTRWGILGCKVTEFQNNVYKGLHDYQKNYNELSQQLQQWSESLTQQFYELCQYIHNKMQFLSQKYHKIHCNFIDVASFTYQLSNRKNRSKAKNSQKQSLKEIPKNQKDPVHKQVWIQMVSQK